ALFTQKETFLAPAFLVDKVADPTGAGDSFAGAFMGYLATAEVSRDLATKNPELWENTLRKAVLAGCVMASFTVEDFGIQRLMRLTKNELLTRQEKLMKMISVQ
ncbi:MAG: PfkB family carbohydrate kinase, partial [bacterium]